MSGPDAIRGITKKRFRPSMVTRDTSDLPVMSGYLMKKSRRDALQKRYFVTTNHYLNYYRSDKKKKILCSFDILYCLDAEVTSRFGDIELEFDDHTVSLSAKDDEEADAWVKNILIRQKLYASLPQYQNILNSAAGAPSEDRPRTNSMQSIVADNAKLFQGMLKKRSPSRFRGWQDRYFRLYEGEVRYYKNEPKALNELDSFAGHFVVSEILDVRPSKPNDQECCVFTIKLKQRDMDLQASSQENLAQWIAALKSAIDAMLKAEAVRKEHGKQAEEATPVVKQDPKFIRYFDSQDPVQRAEKIQQQSVDAFESIMVETVDEVMNVCTEVMDDLNDISEACLSCEPPRFDVIKEYLTFYHFTLLYKVTNFTNGAEVGFLESHEALRLMDFMLAYIHLVDKSFAECLDEDTKLMFDTSEFRDQLGFLRESYCAKAEPTLKEMCGNIAKLVLNDKEKAIMEANDGKYHTAAPLDLFNMIDQFVQIAGRGGMKELQADVIRMCLRGIVHYHDVLRDGVVQLDEPESELLFLCAIINDCDNIGDNIDTQIEEQHREMLEELDEELLEDRLDEVRIECHSLSQYAIGMIRRVIFQDLGDVESQLFNEDWESSESLEILLETIDDYLGDFVDRLVNLSYLTLVGYSFNECIVLYTTNLLDIFVKKDKQGARMKRKSLSKEEVDLVRRDLDSIRSSFAAHIEDGEKAAKRLFKQQWQMTDALVAVLTKNCDDLEQQVFVSIRTELGLTKKDVSPYVYCFLSCFLLLREDLSNEDTRQVLERCRVLMDAEGFALGKLKAEAEDHKLRLRKTEEAEMEGTLAPVDVSKNVLGEDGSLLIQQMFPKAHLQCVYDHEKSSKRSKLSKWGASMMQMTASMTTPGKTSKLKSSNLNVVRSSAMKWMNKSLKKKKPAQKSPTDHAMPEEAKRAMYKLFVDGKITKEDYETMINKHKEFESEAKQMAEESRKRAEEEERLLAAADAGPMQNAKKLLKDGHITKEEFDQLVSTISDAQRAEEAKSAGSFQQKRKSRRESESTHDPLKATKKMLDQGIISQAEYDEISKTILAGQQLFDSDKKPPRPGQNNNEKLVAGEQDSSDDEVDGQDDTYFPSDAELIGRGSAYTDTTDVSFDLPDLPDEIDLVASPSDLPESEVVDSKQAAIDRKVSKHRLKPEGKPRRTSLVNTQKKMRGYLRKRHKKYPRKWDRRYFCILDLHHEGMGRKRKSLAWQKGPSSPVSNSIPVIVIDRAWCDVQPACLVGDDGLMKLPHQLSEEMRAHISDDDIKRSKKGQKNIFHVLTCAGTPHERTLTLRAPNTANMVEWVNNITLFLSLVQDEAKRVRDSENGRKVFSRISMIFDTMDLDLDSETGSVNGSFDESFLEGSMRSPAPSLDDSSASPSSRKGSGRRKDGKQARSARQSYFPMEPVAKESSASLGQKPAATEGLAAILDELDALGSLGNNYRDKSNSNHNIHTQINEKEIDSDWHGEEVSVPASQGCACIIS